MFTLIGSLLGFLGSAFPEILKLMRDNSDRQHELQILDRQIEHAKLNHQLRLEEITINADIEHSKALYRHAGKPSGSKWVDALRASVRPIITYAFFILFATVKSAGLYILITQNNLDIATALIQIWDQQTQALFATIMAFWFGGRAIGKMNSGTRS